MSTKLAALALLIASTTLSLTACDKGPTASAAAKSAPATTAPAGAVPQGTKIGGGVTLPVSTSIAELLANPKNFKDKTVRVEGMILDVCPKRGCWMELAGSEPGQKLKFKVTDGDMVFPMESKGKFAVAEGVVAVADLTLDETRERAKDEATEYGKPFDPASITAPSVSVRINGTGAVIR